jgi:hypothetical protein
MTLRKLGIAMIFLFMIFSCDEGDMKQSAINTVNSESQNVVIAPGPAAGRIQTLYGGDTYIEIQRFEQTFIAGHLNRYSLTVPSDYVIVGGGAMIIDPASHPNAFLFESRPKLGTNEWYASSKDHGTSDIHQLSIVAIGMKVCGLTADQLRSHMSELSSTTNIPQSHNNVISGGPGTGYTMISGGAIVNYGTGYGNLLVSSYPDSNLGNPGWHVESKDHLHSSPATISTYTIWIETAFINGKLNISITHASTVYTSSGPSVNATWTAPLFTTTGALGTYNGQGRMLQAIYPTDPGYPSIYVRNKDQQYGDSGNLTAYAITISGASCF